MAEFTNLPGTLDLRFVRGDEQNFSARFPGLDLTTYTLTAAVYDANTDNATTVQTPTLTVSTETVAGEIVTSVVVSLTEGQTSALSINGRFRWYLRWVTPVGGVTRTVLSGELFVSNP